MKLPEPIRPIYVWGGYFVLALVLAAATGGAEWVKSAMAIYLLWAIIETIRFIRHKRRAKVSQPEKHSEPLLGSARARVADQPGQAEKYSDEEAFQEQYRDWNEDREVAESQLDFETLWEGRKEISFSYRERGWKQPQDVTAVVTRVISPAFGEDAQTYFQGVPTGGAQRYFCLGYLAGGRKVTDTLSGEIGTLRKILGVKRRVYK